MSEPATYKKLPQEKCSLRRRGRGDGTCKERQRRCSEGKNPSVTEFTLLSVKPPPNSPEAKVGFLGLEKQQKSQTSKKGLFGEIGRGDGT